MYFLVYVYMLHESARVNELSCLSWLMAGSRTNIIRIDSIKAIIHSADVSLLIQSSIVVVYNLELAR